MMLKNKVLYIIIILCIFMVCCRQASSNNTRKIIYPAPKEVIYKKGIIKIDSAWQITNLAGQNEYKLVAENLAQEIKENFEFNIYFNSKLLNNYKKIIYCKVGDEVSNKILGEENINSQKLNSNESYIIIARENTIYIISKNPQGAFYASYSLVSLLKKQKDFLLCPLINIVDYPSCNTRAVHFCGADPKLIKEQLKEIAKLKYNTAIIDSWDYFHFDESNKIELWQDIYGYARSLYINPIPELQSFGVAGSILAINPQAAEGIWVRDAKFRFVNNIAKPLNLDKAPMTNILRNNETDIKITSLGKKIIYRENIDYVITDGTMQYPFDKDSKPFVIKRKKNGRIGNNEIVLVSYDYVERKCDFASWSIPYCPSSQITYKIMDKAIYDVVKYLKPSYISIGHDEIRGLNRDSRCLKRNMTNAELFTEDVNKLYNIIIKYNSDLNILMWADMLNPWHNGGNENYQVQFGGISGSTDVAIDMIPSDIILILWHASRDNLKKAPAYFENKGFNYWADGVKWLETDFKPQGVVVTTWKGWQKEKSKVVNMADILW